MLNPGHKGVRDPADLICRTKFCDACMIDQIRGPYYTCTVCVAPCYDLCGSCFEKRSEGGHPHTKFMKVPSSSFPIPTFEEHLEKLKVAIETEIPNVVRKVKFKVRIHVVMES
jgi:hypothetical protein